MRQLYPFYERGREMFALHQTLHASYGVCLWTIIALIILVALIVLASYKIYKDAIQRKLFDKKIRDNYYFDAYDDPEGGRR